MDVKKGLKLKVRRFLGLIPTFVEVTDVVSGFPLYAETKGYSR